MSAAQRAGTADEAEAADDGCAASPGDTGATPGAVDQDAVWTALRTIVDPEIGLDVVTVGLVYEVVETAPGTLRVRYTLTTRGCPLGSVLENGMRAAVHRVPGVEAVEMELVWEPAWTPERMETP